MNTRTTPLGALDLALDVDLDALMSGDSGASGAGSAGTLGSGLAVEWERVEVLAQCLAAARRGEAPAQAWLDRLRLLQQFVAELRVHDEGPWQRLPGAHEIDDFERDVLAALIAPEVLPRVGWLYRQLQGSEPFATAAMVYELLALEGDDGARLRLLLGPDGVFGRHGLLRDAHDDPYQPLRIEPRALALLLGSDVLPAPPGAYAVPTHATWGDLVLPPSHVRMLREFLLWVRERGRVVDEWRGEDVGGPIALFSGPSGTGKTFAAAVLARELGWPLYRVDLGQLVSKYIGETEKNLNRLFAAAHGRQMVLQFDEADALLGKRAEVKDARDRYANLEVSHLLSRIEQHRGPCILTTNLRGHIDAAFTRRIQTIIEFPRPDAAARAQLWRKLLPPQAPRAQALDAALLGAVTMSGGQIRTAALHAAYLAAGEGAEIGPAHAAQAIRRELGKAGRANIRHELGALAAWLPPGDDDER